MSPHSGDLFALFPASDNLLLVVIRKVDLDIQLVPDLVHARPTSTDNVLDIVTADIKLRGLEAIARR